MKDQNPRKNSGGLEDQSRRHRGFPWRKHLSGDFLMKKTKTKFFVCQKGGEEVSILRHNKIVSEKILRQKSKVLLFQKQERRFRLAVTTFPVFVKRTPWISYKPPIYIRYFISLDTNFNLSEKLIFSLKFHPLQQNRRPSCKDS